MSLKTKKIGFIGGGNMAEALLTGLKKSGVNNIWVSEPRAARRRTLSKQYKVKTTASNVEIMQQCNVIVLAIKPQQMNEVLSEMAPHTRAKQLFISIAAGIDTTLMKQHLGKSARIVRAMPNTPALVGAGITGLFASRGVPASDRTLAQAFFDGVGASVFVSPEDQLDWVTAVSGSGPAYVFLFLEHLIEAGVKGGLKPTQARQLALATCRGATELAASQKTPLATLRERVTSKGGTTAAALEVLKKSRWGQHLQQALKAAAHRAAQLRKG